MQFECFMDIRLPLLQMVFEVYKCLTAQLQVVSV
jgi:hypothetical protein